MKTTRGDYHPTRFLDVAVTVDFHCQSACRFCIVQEGMNRYKGLPFERFQKMVDDNRVSRKYERAIFTGGEVTLEKSLLDFVRYARASGSFAHLRIQTNARKLADMDYARSLVEAGVDEYFVSLHGADAKVQDGISQRPGSFDEALAGMRNLQSLGARIITNTVINVDNVAVLADIVAVVAPFGVRRMEFWNYLPMEDHADERNLIAPLDAIVPSLGRALDACRARGIEAVTKYVPRCLLGEHAGTLDNSQADVIIVESFWDEFPRFNCLYEGECEHAESCLGLHHDYVNKFGWEEARLRPTPRAAPLSENDELRIGRPERYGDEGEGDSAAIGDHPAWEALVAGLPAAAGSLVRVQLTRNQARYRFRLLRGATVEVQLAPRDDAAPAFARSRSFNLFYGEVEGEHADVELKALLRTVAALVARRDDGQLSLDPRKGLTEVRRTPAHMTTKKSS
jgi:cyclic pyranopterin phosphate synthase